MSDEGTIVLAGRGGDDFNMMQIKENQKKVIKMKSLNQVL